MVVLICIFELSFWSVTSYNFQRSLSQDIYLLLLSFAITGLSLLYNFHNNNVVLVKSTHKTKYVCLQVVNNKLFLNELFEFLL